MIKKLLTSVAVAFVCVGAVTAADFENDNNERPMVQIIKDHQVIETRQMTDTEFEAFEQLENLEIKFDKLEGPMEAIEEKMEAQAEKIEMVVEAIVEQALDGGFADIEYEQEAALDELKDLASQLKPSIKHIKALAKEMETVAEQFEEAIYQNYDKDDFDSIRVINGDDESTMHFDEFDMGEDFGEVVRFDF